jgi:hypothetical protein
VATYDDHTYYSTWLTTSVYTTTTCVTDTYYPTPSPTYPVHPPPPPPPHQPDYCVYDGPHGSCPQWCTPSRSLRSSTRLQHTRQPTRQRIRRRCHPTRHRQAHTRCRRQPAARILHRVQELLDTTNIRNGRIGQS